MNASKTLTALAAAAALVGTIGYASAQSAAGSDTMAPNAGSPADTTQPAVTTPAPVDNSTSTLPSDAAATMDSERAPQADRN
ncbi:MAG: hypothetical protein ABW067_19660 [Rhizobacter sp.]|jgi:hypothetical protein